MLISAATLAAPQVYELRIDGLACPFCAYGIEKKLGAIEGVERIDVDIRAGNVTVTTADGATFDETTAKQAIEAAGFSLRGFEEVLTTGK